MLVDRTSNEKGVLAKSLWVVSESPFPSLGFKMGSATRPRDPPALMPIYSMSIHLAPAQGQGLGERAENRTDKVLSSRSLHPDAGMGLGEEVKR